MDGIREDCLVRWNQQKLYQGANVWRRVGASLYETSLKLLLISPGRLKNDWLDVINAQKVSIAQ